MNFDHAAGAVLTVGDGRGFVIEGARDRLIITAAHCLPFMPPACSCSYTEERTYLGLLAPLGGTPTAAAECLFVDRVADLAILCEPDNQALPDEAEQYHALLLEMNALHVASAERSGEVWLLSLENRWHKCNARYSERGLFYFNAADGIRAGMSGSPAIDSDGMAVGVVCISGGGPGEVHTAGGPNPNLSLQLPVWALKTSP